MSQIGEDSTTNGTNNLATPEHQQVQDESEVQPSDEPEVPTNVETPVASQCTKVTEDLDALSIDLEKEITVIPETQLSQIPRNVNAEFTSDNNVHTRMEESSSPEDTFLGGIDCISTQLDDAASDATSPKMMPPATQASEDQHWTRQVLQNETICKNGARSS